MATKAERLRDQVRDEARKQILRIMARKGVTRQGLANTMRVKTNYVYRVLSETNNRGLGLDTICRIAVALGHFPGMVPGQKAKEL